MKAQHKQDTQAANKSHRKLTRTQILNQERILAAALTEFSRFGFRGTTVDQIATGSGMSKANILYYFRRKKDIYLAVLEKTLNNWLEPLQSMNPDGDPKQELWKYIQTKIRLSRSSPEASRLFASEILQGAPLLKPFLESELKQVVDSNCEVLQQWIDEGKLIDVPPMHLIFMIWAATQHYADFATQINALTADEEEQIFSDAETTLKKVLLRGMLNGTAH